MQTLKSPRPAAALRAASVVSRACSFGESREAPASEVEGTHLFPRALQGSCWNPSLRFLVCSLGTDPTPPSLRTRLGRGGQGSWERALSGTTFCLSGLGLRGQGGLGGKPGLPIPETRLASLGPHHVFRMGCVGEGVSGRKPGPAHPARARRGRLEDRDACRGLPLARWSPSLLPKRPRHPPLSRVFPHLANTRRSR